MKSKRKTKNILSKSLWSRIKTDAKGSFQVWCEGRKGERSWGAATKASTRKKKEKGELKEGHQSYIPTAM